MSETPEYDGLFGNDDELSLSRTFIPPPPPYFEPQPTVNELKRRIIELTKENNTLRNRLSKYENPDYIDIYGSLNKHCLKKHCLKKHYDDDVISYVKMGG